jgi:hypothetical protein
MFKIECFVDDKKLGQALMALSGIAYDVTPTPVVNAKREGKAVKQIASSKLELLMAGLQSRKLTQFSAADCRAIFGDAYPEYAYSTPLGQAIELGLIKKMPAANNKYQRYKLTGKKLKS